MMKRPDLVIFDCDGVLVDTESAANTVLARWLTQAGLPMTMAQSRARFMGRNMGSVRDIVLTEDGIDLGADFAERWRNALPETFAGGVPAISGIREVLDALDAAAIRYCVASSGTVDKMHLTLGSAGLLERLEPVLFSATMVAHGKPAPDLFEFAAAKMGAGPSACVVIEDSKFGAQAARAAGMACLGYVGDPLTDGDALQAHGAVLFDDMTELPALLGLVDR